MGTHEIIDGKVVLIIKEPGAPSQYLLELHHIVDRTHQHNVAHVAGVNTCGEFL